MFWNSWTVRSSSLRTKLFQSSVPTSTHYKCRGKGYFFQLTIGCSFTNSMFFVFLNGPVLLLVSLDLAGVIFLYVWVYGKWDWIIWPKTLFRWNTTLKGTISQSVTLFLVAKSVLVASLTKRYPGLFLQKTLVSTFHVLREKQCWQERQETKNGACALYFGNIRFQAAASLLSQKKTRKD